MVDHHVDRPEVEAEQSVQLTGTNRSIGLIPTRGTPAPHHRPRAAPSPTRLQTLLTSHPPSHPRELRRPGGHSEGPNTRSHPELGRENPLRPWYCRSSGGRVGRRQARPRDPRAMTRGCPCKSWERGPHTPTLSLLATLLPRQVPYCREPLLAASRRPRRRKRRCAFDPSRSAD